MMKNPIKILTGKEKKFWVLSLVLVAISNIVSESRSMLALLAALIGVTAVLFCAKGNVWGQILMAVFCILYGIISWQFRYWGEMLTYLGMTFPMALWSVYTWMKNPSEENSSEVAISTLSVRQKLVTCIFAIIVTGVFYGFLSRLDTPNLLFSTISVTTSFFAATLTMLRSSYYAFWYGMNDLVLIILWTLASFENPAYISVVANFVVFFANDMYGFYDWRKREKCQSGNR